MRSKPSFTTGQVARICQVTKGTVINWIDRGRLRGYRIPGSRHRRVAQSELRAFIKRNRLPAYDDSLRPRVLVVDDDRDLLELLQDALRDRYDVDVAATAITAAMRFEVFKPDIILLDIRLPDVSGLEVCRQFQPVKEGPRVPILTMSAYGNEIDPADIRRCGADDFFPKPLKLADLRRRIESMVG